MCPSRLRRAWCRRMPPAKPCGRVTRHCCCAWRHDDGHRPRPGWSAGRRRSFQCRRRCRMQLSPSPAHLGTVFLIGTVFLVQPFPSAGVPLATRLEPRPALPAPQSLRPVLSTSRCTGSALVPGRGTSSVSARRLGVLWSGTARLSPSRPMTEPRRFAAHPKSCVVQPSTLRSLPRQPKPSGFRAGVGSRHTPPHSSP